MTSASSKKASTPPARRTRNASRRKSLPASAEDSKKVDDHSPKETNTLNDVANPVKITSSINRSTRKRSKITQDSDLSEDDSKIVKETPSRRRSARINSDSEDDYSKMIVAPRSKSKKTKTDILQMIAEQSDDLPSVKSPEVNESAKKREVMTDHFDPNENEISVQVHRFRNANYVPKAIIRISATPYSPDNNHCPYLAISREGGGVELVSVNEKWKCVGKVEGIRNRNVDAMAWVCGNYQDVTNVIGEDASSNPSFFSKDHELAYAAHAKRKLFGGSRDGTLFEIDFKTKSHKGVIGSGGGAVFCLTSLSQDCEGTGRTCAQMIASGCEDGSVRIYEAAGFPDKSDVNYPCLNLVSTLPSVGSAITSIAWLPGTKLNGLDGGTIFAGVADGTIRQFQCCLSTQNPSITGSAFRAISTGSVLNDDALTSRTEGHVDSLFALQWKAGPRITVENRGRRTSTKVWALAVLNDGTIVSGDSMGNIQFWDSKATTLIQSFEHNPNNADVLDLAINFKQNKILASGVDSKVICIERVPDTMKWVLTNQQRSHSHDVNSLAIVYMSDPTGCCSNSNSKTRELLCSGGIDTRVCSYFIDNMKKYRSKVAYKYPTKAPVAMSCKPRILSIMRDDKIDFFQLARHPPSSAIISVDEHQIYIGSVSIQSSFNLVSHDLSNDGRFLAISHSGGSFLFSLEFRNTFDVTGKSTTVVIPTKIPLNSASNASYSVLKFGSDGLLCGAKANGEVILLKVVEQSGSFMAELVHTCESTTSLLSFPPSQITISHNNEWIGVSSNNLCKGSVQIYSVKEAFKHWWTLPCTEAPVSCIKFLGCGQIEPALAVACNNGAFYLFDVDHRRLSDWSEDLGFPAVKYLPREIFTCTDCPDSIAFNPATPNKFLIVSNVVVIINYLIPFFFRPCQIQALAIYMEDIEIFFFLSSIAVTSHW